MDEYNVSEQKDGRTVLAHGNYLLNGHIVWLSEPYASPSLATLNALATEHTATCRDAI